ncbi:MAG: Holliday junction branch migration DNA helicase RuvB [Patescibacteria group bacterium]
METDRIIDQNAIPGDEAIDIGLRPKSFDGYIGQDPIKDALGIAISAAKMREEPLDHILLFGPPGLGKTTLAHIIANEMGVNLHSTSGPAIERPGDLASILTNLKEGDVLFIDEIHRLGRSIEEVLYSAMEDFFLDIMVGKGPSARSIKLSLPKFTLIGATTRVGSLSSPLRDRFGALHRLDYYSAQDIQKIVQRASTILNVELPDSAAELISLSSRFTPRTANRILKQVRDFATVKNEGNITREVVANTLTSLAIDDAGLDELDRKILTIIIQQFKGGPVGVNSLAASLGEESQTIEDVYEPYLIQQGFLQRTAQGRAVTPKAYQHLNFEIEVTK